MCILVSVPKGYRVRIRVLPDGTTEVDVEPIIRP